MIKNLRNSINSNIYGVWIKHRKISALLLFLFLFGFYIRHPQQKIYEIKVLCGKLEFYTYKYSKERTKIYKTLGKRFNLPNDEDKSRYDDFCKGFLGYNL